MQTTVPQSPQPSEQTWQPSKKTVITACFIGLKAVRHQRRQPLSTEQQEKIVAQWRAIGVPEERVSLLVIYMNAVGKGLRDREHLYRIDKYLVGGCGIFDIALFTALASTALTDAALHISWLALVFSLPCTAGSLIFCFVRPPASVKNYGNIHGWLSTLSIFGAFIATIAFVWHIWVLAGVLFLVISLLVGILGIGYASLLNIAKHLIPDLSSSDPGDQDTILYG